MHLHLLQKKRILRGKIFSHVSGDASSIMSLSRLLNAVHSHITLSYLYISLFAWSCEDTSLSKIFEKTRYSAASEIPIFSIVLLF